ncbi:unnamed protein product [Malassezia sympodialis ATCC 42132]|uniref:Catalase n=1 Tax=Malassezia sympodialis (strain ATCC 42132) TaxID=1230383 RepID=M5ECX6_MALS4|nr:uncharacterized protein MSY001_2906 [Malassezia sympodialis ATCC 42132]CCV00201.1 unnamed protein product [Malassezia sympodialis ATCC 42132]SHO78799.1 Similar to S.cerevisiae protein CTA1 (Catalase A) [Malassezia sympodialis ATCC 42132]|eukprot:XP_018741408.1 uncharacterized protein MSY001_2906 [Malassezia sympodialis ATCC 42132]
MRLLTALLSVVALATYTQATAGVNVTYGNGAETHQLGGSGNLTTDQGVPIADDENSLRSGSRGPSLLEDFILREKIFHFDHERIPERIVHARGSAAHGYFEATEDISYLTNASVLRKGTKTPAFARLSTVVGGASSVDTPRDVRGFAVKFYTQEGNWDLVGINFPVFFIQDAIKFPDLIHSVKMEADRGYPGAASAHDTFYDFASLMPESTHMLMWLLSDRAIPRSLRTMDGFGVHTFQFVNATGHAHFVRFHWRAKLGVQSNVWDEASKLQGADNDYHRRDLYESIENGMFPEWELGVQVFDREFADKQFYDVLDPTKLIPEEDVPLKIIGRLVLNRNPDNFFAENEQSAFCPSHVVPGIDFSDDPLLQGRLFSYLDTQRSRFGSPNFHQLPINAPKVPVNNFQRDGMMQSVVNKGRASYQPNSLNQAKEPTGPRACPFGFGSSKAVTGPREIGPKMRIRDERFKDHYSQARLFWKSQTSNEQQHIVEAFTFELSKVTLPFVRERMVSNLRNVDEGLAQGVALGLGMKLPPKSDAMAPIHDMKPSKQLSIQKNWKNTLMGRNVGILITNGTDGSVLDKLVSEIKKNNARATLIAPTVGGIRLKDGSMRNADVQLAGSPSVLYDAVALVLSSEGTKSLMKQSAAVQFVMDAFSHLKAIGASSAAKPLLNKAGVQQDAGVTDLSDSFIQAAKKRFWDREMKVRPSP